MGSTGAKELETGEWGMVVGDVDQDSTIDSQDYSIWLFDAMQSASGYQVSDFNFDTVITTSDYRFWHNNSRAGYQFVPD